MVCCGIVAGDCVDVVNVISVGISGFLQFAFVISLTLFSLIVGIVGMFVCADHQS